MEIITEGIDEAIALVEASGIESLTKPMFTEIALFAMTRVKARTQKGLDAEENAFEPYTPRYAAFRRRKGHPINVVNLTFSGRMLGQGMTFEATSTEVKVFFADTRDPDNQKVTQAEKAIYNADHRNFFQMNASDIDLIMGIVERYRRASLR